VSTEQSRREKSLSKALTHVLEECRMVLPGIQALFGFQLIAVFNPGFRENLGDAGQYLHLAATGLVAVAIALVMTPAAYHRQRMPEGVSEEFILLASKLLLLSMVPLGIATSIELSLIGSIIFGHLGPAVLLGVGFALTFGGLWFVLPRALGGTKRSPRGGRIVPEPATQG
jgi:hypothetical protein